LDSSLGLTSLGGRTRVKEGSSRVETPGLLGAKNPALKSRRTSPLGPCLLSSMLAWGGSYLSIHKVLL
jgi:hypothetical protein